MIGKYFSDGQISTSGWVLLLLSGVLLFVFSLPHAMALRKLLLFASFLISLPIFWKVLQTRAKPLLHLLLFAFALQIWMLLIVVFVADQPAASFSEWKGQWLPVMMALVIGIGLAYTLMQCKIKNPRSAVALLILIPIILFLAINAIVMAVGMIESGKFLAYQLGITDEHGITNHLVALIEPILIADLLGRLVKGGRLIPVLNWAIWAILILALFSLFAASSRNGLINMLFVFILGAVMTIAEFRKIYSLRKIMSVVLATLALVLAIAVVAHKTDSRWQTFIETIPIAWDIDRDLRWLNVDGIEVPTTPSGQKVDTSEYNRIAWAHEGWRMLVAHPWGTEISRDTFHKLEVQKYGQTELSHSHNGWIDLGLNVGVLGLILWGGFLWLLARFGWRAWQRHKEPLGLALAIMVIMFAVRGLLDSIFRNHVIEQFVLVAALLYTALLLEYPDDQKNA